MISFRGMVPKTIRLLRDTDFSHTFHSLTVRDPSGLHFLAACLLKAGLYVNYFFSCFFSLTLSSVLRKYVAHMPVSRLKDLTLENL